MIFGNKRGIDHIVQQLAAVEIGESGNEPRERVTNTEVEGAIVNRSWLKRSGNVA